MENRKNNMIAQAARSELSTHRPHAGGADAQSHSSSLPHLLAVLSRRRNTAISVFSICLLGALLFLWRVTPVYTSTARICAELTGPKLLNEQDQVQITPERADSYLYTQADVLCSIPILTAALGDPEVGKTDVIARVHNPLVFLKKAVAVDVGKKDDIISASFSAPDPAEATIVLNAIVKSYLDYAAQQQKGTANQMLTVLNQEKSRNDAELAKQQNDLLVFKENNSNVFFKTDRGTIVMQDLATASDELTPARAASCAGTL